MSAKETEFFIKKNLLSDEVNLLNLGQSDENEFEQITHSSSVASNFKNTWPTKDDRVTFRLQSVRLNLSQEQTVTERSTYSLLEWIGDIGGLFDGLYLLASNLIAPIAAYTMRFELLSQTFKRISTGSSAEEKKFTPQNYLKNLSCCCLRRRTK